MMNLVGAQTTDSCTNNHAQFANRAEIADIAAIQRMDRDQFYARVQCLDVRLCDLKGNDASDKD
jgi:hypothetical protein